jgi:hypothetical protein
MDSILVCMCVSRTPCGRWGLLWQTDPEQRRPIVTDVGLNPDGSLKVIPLLYPTYDEARNAFDAVAHMIDQGFMLPSVIREGVLVELHNRYDGRPLC